MSKIVKGLEQAVKGEGKTRTLKVDRPLYPTAPEFSTGVRPNPGPAPGTVRLDRETYPEMAVLIRDLASAGEKLKTAMLDGPEGPNCVLTPAEATVIYRVLVERCGFKL